MIVNVVPPQLFLKLLYVTLAVNKHELRACH